MRFSRADRSRLAEWWFTVDHALLAAILVLMAAGLVLSLAASPAVALKKGLPMYHFVERQLVFSVLGLAVMLAVSLLTPIGVRRLALALFLAALAGLIAVHVSGAEFNGARRWLSLAGYSLQPSEFAKPGFVVLAAWLFAEARRRSDVPALPLAAVLGLGLAGLLVAQPDIGQTLLVGVIWGALYVLSGQPLVGAVVLALAGGTGAAASYWMLDHVRARRPLPLPDARRQLADRPRHPVLCRGWLPRPRTGRGTIKSTLPDAHTDFIFAVVAEEYGVVACLALLALFAFLVLRALLSARREPDAATRLAVQGLASCSGCRR